MNWFIKSRRGQPGWLNGLPLPSAQGLILGSWDRVLRRAPCMEPASPSAWVLAPLSLSLSWINKIFIFFKILFIYSWETQRERQRQRHRHREKQAPCREPDAGLDPRTPGSRPGLKADAQLLSHPGVSVFYFSFLSCQCLFKRGICICIVY